MEDFTHAIFIILTRAYCYVSFICYLCDLYLIFGEREKKNTKRLAGERLIKLLQL